MTSPLEDAARATLEAARAKGLKIATAESCTGGLVAAALTDIAGSSDVMERGFVTYSNEAKVELLNVDAALIAVHGAVSAPVAKAMAIGALERSRAAKPVGLVHFACARRGFPVSVVERRFGDLGRAEVRDAAAAHALAMLREACA